MTLFFFHLRRPNDTARLIGSCSIVGESQGFSPREREFDDLAAASQALEAAGVAISRLEYAFGRTYGHWATTLEVTPTQAQLLDVLRLDNIE